jgi:hypothetical protein
MAAVIAEGALTIPVGSEQAAGDEAGGGETESRRPSTSIGRGRAGQTQSASLSVADLGFLEAPLPDLRIAAVERAALMVVTEDCLRAHLWGALVGAFVVAFAATAFALAASGVATILHPYLSVVLLAAGGGVIRLSWMSLSVLVKREASR